METDAITEYPYAVTLELWDGTRIVSSRHETAQECKSRYHEEVKALKLDLFAAETVRAVHHNIDEIADELVEAEADAYQEVSAGV